MAFNLWEEMENLEQRVYAGTPMEGSVSGGTDGGSGSGSGSDGGTGSGVGGTNDGGSTTLTRVDQILFGSQLYDVYEINGQRYAVNPDHPNDEAPYRLETGPDGQVTGSPDFTFQDHFHIVDLPSGGSHGGVDGGTGSDGGTSGDGGSGGTVDGGMSVQQTSAIFKLDNGYYYTADVTVGTTGNDALYLAGFTFGGAGNDTITGVAGNDSLDGGAGNDSLLGGAGNDWIDGGDGNDIVYGGAGADYLDGGAGNDVLSYFDAQGGVTVKLWANSVSGDIAQGDVISGFENVSGGAGGDWLEGDNDDNVLDGCGGGDLLLGFGGNDLLLGREGNDTLIADWGTDILEGGSGSDLFAIWATTQHGIINDFVHGQDHVQLSSSLFAGFAALRAAAVQHGADVVVTGEHLDITLKNVQLSTLTASDFQFV